VGAVQVLTIRGDLASPPGRVSPGAGTERQCLGLQDAPALQHKLIRTEQEKRKEPAFSPNPKPLSDDDLGCLRRMAALEVRLLSVREQQTESRLHSLAFYGRRQGLTA
jgi:hypothetical protein